MEWQRDDRRVDAPGLECRLQMLGQVLLDLQRHLRRALVKRRYQVREQIRRDRVDHAKAEHADQLVASRLRDVADASTFCACSTMRSPTGVTVTSDLARSKSCVASSSSSFWMAIESAGWLIKQRWAARP